MRIFSLIYTIGQPLTYTSTYIINFILYCMRWFNQWGPSLPQIIRRRIIKFHLLRKNGFITIEGANILIGLSPEVEILRKKKRLIEQAIKFHST